MNLPRLTSAYIQKTSCRLLIARSSPKDIRRNMPLNPWLRDDKYLSCAMVWQFQPAPDVRVLEFSLAYFILIYQCSSA
jgi:hypothetical protein